MHISISFPFQTLYFFPNRESSLLSDQSYCNALIDFSVIIIRVMAEIAKLVDVFSSGDDLSQRLRADSSLNLGFRKLCSILRQAVEPVAGDGNKLGLQFWDQSQIQAVTSLALTLVNSTRSLSGTLSTIIYVFMDILARNFMRVT